MWPHPRNPRRAPRLVAAPGVVGGSVAGVGRPRDVQVGGVVARQALDAVLSGILGSSASPLPPPAPLTRATPWRAAAHLIRQRGCLVEEHPADQGEGGEWRNVPLHVDHTLHSRVFGFLPEAATAPPAASAPPFPPPRPASRPLPARAPPTQHLEGSLAQAVAASTMSSAAARPASRARHRAASGRAAHRQRETAVMALKEARGEGGAWEGKWEGAQRG